MAISVQLTKADRSVEPFDEGKLSRSIRAAGASEGTASEVARAIEREGSCATTGDVRARVMDELRARDPHAARLYETNRRLVVRKAIEAMKGIARIPPEVASSMRLRQVEPVQISTDGRVSTLMTELNERTAIRGNEVRLNAADMLALGVEDGDRVLVTRPVRDEGRSVAG